MKKIIYLLPFVISLAIGCTNNQDNRSAKEIAKVVAEKIIKETVFEFQKRPQKTVVDVQVLDYKNQYNTDNKNVYYSLSNIIVDKDTTIKYGFEYCGAIKIFINSSEVFVGRKDNKVIINEIAYNMFDWNEVVSLPLLKGKNKILIKMIPVNNKPAIVLREYPKTGDSPLSSKFESVVKTNDPKEFQWVTVGGFPSKTNVNKSLAKQYPPEKKISEKYSYNGGNYEWNSPKANLLNKLVIPESNSYKRESYIEWHYANGTTLLGMLNVADALKENQYSKFVSKVCSYNLTSKEMLKNEYENYYAIRGSNNRMFRKSMLDDTGAPAIPYLQTYLNDGPEELKPLIEEMADYVLNDQVRLEDKTFCRPEPEAMTIWADDLFMSVPFLLRMGKLTGDNKYYDDAALQIINFYKYLFDSSTGLYKHCWFSASQSKSEIFWGRANGWIVWATSEALMRLPKEHKDYNKILKQFRNHINGLVKYQSDEGMWHQVLDKPESFKETSCTAMYILGIARGVQYGWLDNQYKKNAVLAFNEMKSKISKEGTVKDICRGTGIGHDYEFYFNRKRFDNDPRGLGAVLTAASEMIYIESNN